MPRRSRRLATVQQDRDELLGIEPAARIREIHQRLARLDDDIRVYSEMRRTAISELLVSEGASQSDLAKQLAISRGRVSQRLTRKPAPERSFLVWGAKPLTIVVGGSHEWHQAQAAAAEQLQELAN